MPDGGVTRRRCCEEFEDGFDVEARGPFGSQKTGSHLEEKEIN